MSHKVSAKACTGVSSKNGSNVASHLLMIECDFHCCDGI